MPVYVAVCGPDPAPPEIAARAEEIGKLLAPIVPPAIFCIGLNYRRHAEETKAPIPAYPILFMKGPNAVQNPGDPVLLPVFLRSDKVDYEGELAVIIGKRCRNVRRDQALDYVRARYVGELAQQNDISRIRRQQTFIAALVREVKSAGTLTRLDKVVNFLDAATKGLTTDTEFDSVTRLGKIKRVRIDDLPLYNQDDDAHPAEQVLRLKSEIREADGLLFVTPEYNRSIPGVLKNAIDWASRPEPGEKPLAAFAGKIAGLMSASPGALGGLRGLVTLRSILGNIQVLVVPQQVTIPNAAEAFDDAGALRDAKKRAALDALAQQVVTLAGKIRA